MPAELKNELTALFPGFAVRTVVEDFDGSQLKYAIILSNAQTIKSIELSGSKVLIVDEYGNCAGPSASGGEGADANDA